MYQLVRPGLFAIDPERAHDWTVGSMRRLGQILGPKPPLSGRSVEVAGLQFANPVGLAAGLDKNAEAVSGFSRLGFGHIEVGTVTPQPQPGNPKPRVFRLTQDQGLINRFGFNNDGVDALVRRLSDHPFEGVLGVNIGKNKATPNASAADDYVTCLRAVSSVCDYVTLNVSSPNTPGLRDLADAKRIVDIVQQVLDARDVNRRRQRLPIFVKLAPDFVDHDLEQVLEALVELSVDGVILTNTTVQRQGLQSNAQHQTGGLSGRPLTVQSEHCLRVADAHLSGRLPIISVGGIMTADDAQTRFALGASLVQVYTGLIYTGPGLVKQIVVKTR